MKKILFLLLNVLFTLQVTAQRDFNDSILESRNKITEHAMIGLGGWAILNIGTGFALASATSGEAKYFWDMNAYWNFINLGLATLGYARVVRAKKQVDFADNYEAQQAIEKLYVFNMGLDLAYITGGFYLIERGQTQQSQDSQNRYMGYGKSIILQGSFLLFMDACIYSFHRRNTRIMNKKLKGLNLNLGLGAVSFTYSF
jgi:hypothetical protein